MSTTLNLRSDTQASGETLYGLLNDVRHQIEPDPGALNEARERLGFVLAKANTFHGSLGTYRSGSLAAHTMNGPVTDGDGGLVLNRNFYPGLGPEGTGGDAPGEIVQELVDYMRPLIRASYPDAKMHTSKRGPKIYFHAPLYDGTDPTVDLVLALNRKEGDGIWIPNLKTNNWEPSDPEEHVRLFNSGTASFRSTRRKVMRLAKAWNKQFDKPGASSFEMCVWGYEFVEPGMSLARGLHALFDGAAARLEAGDPTPDPAGVSKNLRLLNNDPGTMALRLRKAAGHMQDAIGATGEESIRAAANGVFWDYINAPATAALTQAAILLKARKPMTAATLGVAVAGVTTGAVAARAYGGRAR